MSDLRVLGLKKQKSCHDPHGEPVSALSPCSQPAYPEEPPSHPKQGGAATGRRGLKTRLRGFHPLHRGSVSGDSAGGAALLRLSPSLGVRAQLPQDGRPGRG